MTDYSDPAATPARLPARLEVSGLIRRVEAAGGFAMVLAKGEPDAGGILVVLTDKGKESRAFERMPSLSGGRVWTLAKADRDSEPRAFAAWLERRRNQDPDLWIVELDVPEGDRFIG